MAWMGHSGMTLAMMPGYATDDELNELSTATGMVKGRLWLELMTAHHRGGVEMATPQRRLETLRRLADAGVTVGVNVAPVIPGLNDEELPAVLEAAREAGATRAGWVLLRLPGAVATVFEERLRTQIEIEDAAKIIKAAGIKPQ